MLIPGFVAVGDLLKARQSTRKPSTRNETKNLYFQLIHEAWFCDKVLAEFGVDPQEGMIVVNGPCSCKSRKRRATAEESGKAVFRTPSNLLIPNGTE